MQTPEISLRAPTRTPLALEGHVVLACFLGKLWLFQVILQVEYSLGDFLWPCSHWNAKKHEQVAQNKFNMHYGVNLKSDPWGLLSTWNSRILCVLASACCTLSFDLDLDWYGQTSTWPPSNSKCLLDFIVLHAFLTPSTSFKHNFWKEQHRNMRLTVLDSQNHGQQIMFKVRLESDACKGLKSPWELLLTHHWH